MDQPLQTYIEESRALLEDMEAILLHLESAPDDRESLNALFRAAHTIKGSAGLFGLDPIVSFTHVAENVLDRLRDGQLAVSAGLVELLLQCRDHVSGLIDTVAEAGAALSDEQQQAGERLLLALHAVLGEPGTAATAPAAPPVPKEHAGAVETSGGGRVESDAWHLSLRFGRDVLRNGMDPASFIRYLATLGEIVSLTTLAEALPEAAAMDPEGCYLGFEIRLRSEADKQAVENVFEFVHDDCDIHILPPRSLVEDYFKLIEALPEDNHLMGEILVASGALTTRELELALACQNLKAAAEPPDEAGPCAPGKPVGQILVERGDTYPEIVDRALKKQQQGREHKAQEARFVRVHADKLDGLIDLVGELVIAGAANALLAGRSGNAALTEASSAVTRLVEEIRDSALRLRMVPIGETFNRFQRVVRDVGRELGKDIALEISGADTELDKTVVEKIADPLMHLVRNAMDHGIESAEVRAAQGKPARGTLRLNAYHDSGGVVIEVSDDGGGLKKDRILQKAWERGLIAPNQNLSDSEIHQLIFEAGFSTADAVTNLSGRGVGMDVVKKNIVALRGTVDLDSGEGRGTTARIRLPLTLAIIDGFLVGVGSASYVVPLDTVMECLELSAGERAALARRNYINLRGEVLPLIRLRDSFELGGEAPKRENIVVVSHAGQRTGLVVDALLGEFQAVIKPLGRMFRHLKGIGGSTILGSGEVALILDVAALVKQATAREMAATDAAQTAMH